MYGSLSPSSGSDELPSQHSRLPTLAPTTLLQFMDRHRLVALPFAALFLLSLLVAPSPPAASVALLGATFPSSPNAWSLLPPSSADDHSDTLTSLPSVSRGADSSPSKLLSDESLLPTNRWYQNLLIGLPALKSARLTDAHRAYVLPYIVDALFSPLSPNATAPCSSSSSSPAPAGLRVHSPNVAPGGDKIVQLEFDPGAGISLGGTTPAPGLLGATARKVNQIYRLPSDSGPNLLSVALEWYTVPSSTISSIVSSLSSLSLDPPEPPAMRAPLVRGSPYVTMEYEAGIIPTLTSDFYPLTSEVAPSTGLYLAVDDTTSSNTTLHCDTGETVTVTKSVTLSLIGSDFTYILYPSRPLDFKCRSAPPPPPAPPLAPGVVGPARDTSAVFELFAAEPLAEPLTLRLALASNCTTGANLKFCQNSAPTPPSKSAQFRRLLDLHANKYPTNDAAVEYTFPTMTKFEATSADVVMHFDWKAKDMKGTGEGDVLMYALPHHVDILEPVPGSQNGNTGLCDQPTMHGPACLVLGGDWAMRELLGDPDSVSFEARKLPRAAMIPDLAQALKEDVHYRLPQNYMMGAGDTYFSGKMLAKVARVLTIDRTLKALAAEDDARAGDDEERAGVVKAVKKVAAAGGLPTDAEVEAALEHLKQGATVWLNGTALAPFVYDAKWGGVVNCGCAYDDGGDPADAKCNNAIGASCPGLTDPGNNFGHGFYNDHHFHHGYHIYAAAVIASFDAAWGRKYFEPVMSLVRDIANPSAADKHFPLFRHKDWFLGSSWASGIGLINGGPYPNGRNQESSSEAIAAYEAVALYGATMYGAWSADQSASETDNDKSGIAANVRDLGRLLLATETRSADTYWHVRKEDSPEHRRIYPVNYTPNVVGMLWSTMAQFQTWFGSDPFLAIGIQLMPLTVASEKRDELGWATEMYPEFEASCNSSTVCVEQGWSVLVAAIGATVGHPEKALAQVLEIPASAFTSAGGNGHSLTNTIWYIATRPEVYDDGEDEQEETEDESGDKPKATCRPCTHTECSDSRFNECPTKSPFVCVAGISLGGCSKKPWKADGGGEGGCDECCEYRAGC
ncbi:hypothetical protein TeGR_g9517 [Tetraparma gracilis]|uniref:glucan endo-1,3-beta-D-glucosidase n=1 Tax=Tetraparma gracilis TaxID=2962635 RepID=A0ABQ6N543_9STRA|nr:hypothetical protein TeGR_g9517 [Tetraparma gracilis]